MIAPNRSLDFLLHARKFGLKFGLETMLCLAEALGSPHRQLRFIHIAGTNGKGSTAAFCAAALRVAGYVVGLYTSPHLSSLRERICVTGIMIPEATFNRLLTRIADAAQSLQLQPTFFEIMTLVALLHFLEAEVDCVVWETGLGGALDATNVVTPEISIITTIGFDHQQYLGNSIEAIANEKAGIIKSGVPVVTGVQQPNALAVIEERARQIQSPLTILDQDHCLTTGEFSPEGMTFQIDGKTFISSLVGVHQPRNAACAYAALKTLNDVGFKVPLNAIQEGFKSTKWPGRFHVIRGDPPFVLDGAHNLQAIEALLESWRTVYGDLKFHLVFGALVDKPIGKMARLLQEQATSVTLVEVMSERTATTAMLQPCFSSILPKCSHSLAELWPALLDSSSPVLVTGSLFLIGQALGLAYPNEYTATDQDLNERLTVVR